MKVIFLFSANQSVRFKIPCARRRAYWTAIWLASLACGVTARAQTNNNTPAYPATNAPPASGSATNGVNKLNETTVFGNLDTKRSQILPDLGATTYTVTKEQIAAIPQDENAGFNQVILRMPGVAEDSLGQLHLRGEHANIQYRINDVVLPEGISGFGAELDTRFVESARLITGSLPAEYGFRTAGVVDLTTKTGAFENGGAASIYGGSYDTIAPSFELGGHEGKWNYFIDGAYNHNGIGIENPTASATPIHDTTDQYKTFAYLSYILDDTSRVTLMGSASYADFQIPINPNLQPISTQPDGNPWTPAAFNSSALNDNQNEQNYYVVAAYQKSAGDLNLQLAAYARRSSVHYTPDAVQPVLYFNGGVATDDNRILDSGGFQADASYNLTENHTLRGGFAFLGEAVSVHSATTVFPVDPMTGNVNGAQETIFQSTPSHAYFSGVYLQDEWKVFPKFTLNYGGRFDDYSSTTDNESQFSPRVNAIYNASDATTLHAGYAHYFTPPPLESVPGATITAFNNTSGQSGVTQGTPVESERANYYDAGVTQEILPGFQVGVDGYYKTAKNQLDDGYFGQSLIASSFNFNEGRIHGLEFTSSYAKGGFSSYANVAISQAQGKGAASAQFLWPDATTLNYVNHNWIYLDHDQFITGSFGAAYGWQESHSAGTRVFMDALVGSGLRTDGGTIPGSAPTEAIPNFSSVPDYYSISLGVEQDFKLSAKQHLKARIDVVNVTDKIYQLRTGSGVGVNASQYGERRGIFGTLTWVF